MSVQPTSEEEALPSIDKLKIADRRDQDSPQQKVTTANSMEEEQPTMVTASPSSISFVHTEGGSIIGAATTTTIAGLSEKEIAQQKEIRQLQALARQIEYYFSQQNLSNDTYLQTLRNLNDGCVPVSILANFAKVKAILTPPKAWCSSSKKVPAAVLLQEEEARIHAVLQSVNEYTDLLKIHSIDTATGKIATDETPSSALTILAVGAAAQEPLMHAESSSSSLMQLTETSTIILRDVDPVVTEEEVRGLLDGLECPPITRVVSDVANCWFITFDTSDRTELMHIMMQLRHMTYPSTGHYVMARLKASSVTASPVDVYNTLPTDERSANAAVTTHKKLRKKRKKRPKKKKKATNSPNNNSSSSSIKESVSFATAEEAVLTFTEDHFPSLQDEKVEWETERVDVRDSERSEEDDSSEDSTKNGEDCEEPKAAKALSDAASTATTTSSTNTTLSTTGFDLTGGASTTRKEGYAAAVLQAIGAPAIKEVPSPAGSRSVSASSSSNGSGNEDNKALPAPVVSITSAPQPWGGGSRSFVDVVREQEST